MKYFIKMWPDSTATLVTNHGKTLMVFDNIEEAQRTLRNLTSRQAPRDLPLNLTPLNSIRSVA